MKLRSAVAALALMALLPVAGMAQDVPAALNFAKTLKFDISAPFAGPSGLKGWVLSNGGNHMVVYTTTDGQTVIMGEVIDAAGKNWTKEASATKVPKPDFNKFAAQLEKSAHIITGARYKEAKTIIYAFLDPNCGYCNLAARALAPYEAVGLQVRWIPVAFLDPASSAGKAAAMLQSANPTAALQEHERRYALDRKGIDPVAPTAATRTKLEANIKLMNEMGITGTPAILYKDGSGDWTLKAGMARLSELPEITRLPEQVNTDAALQQFK